jgi:hypothetical protein
VSGMYHIHGAVLVGATSAGGLTALAVKKIRAKTGAKKIPTLPSPKEKSS